MDEELKLLIEQFNDTQKKAVDVLEREFGCKRPESNMDFVSRCAPHIRNAGYECGGYKIRPHGYGMEIEVAGKTIDFDFGINGEIDGFDAWRLSYFSRRNNLKNRLKSEEDINSAILGAVDSGHIVKSEGLNYYTRS